MKGWSVSVFFLVAMPEIFLLLICFDVKRMNVCEVLTTSVNVIQFKKGYASADNSYYLFRCNHVKGCIIETSTEAFATDNPFKGKRVEHFLSDNLYTCCKVRQNKNGSFRYIPKTASSNFTCHFRIFHPLNEFESDALDHIWN